MIKYTLVCANAHEFESWFASSDAYETQAKRGLVACPHCGDTKVDKALMAPSVSTGRKKDARAQALRAAIAAQAQAGQFAGQLAGQIPSAQPVALLDETQKQLRENIRALHAKIVAGSEDVGDRFPDEARRMHEGEAPARSIRGQATIEQAKELWDEGIPVLPVPGLPDDRN